MLYDVEKMKQELIEVDKQLYQRGLTAGGAGGGSIRIPCYNYDGSKVWTDNMLIKGWACRIGLEWVPTYQYVATVNLDGTVMGTERPKMEVDIHRLVYKVRDDVGAVIHAHPSYLTAFMMVRHKLNKSQESFLKNYTGGINEVLTEAPAAADAVHGSIELAENVAEAFKGNKKKLVFMENHGITVAGGDLYDAFFTLDNMENVAKVFFLVHMKLE